MNPNSETNDEDVSTRKQMKIYLRTFTQNKESFLTRSSRRQRIKIIIMKSARIMTMVIKLVETCVNGTMVMFVLRKHEQTMKRTS